MMRPIDADALGIGKCNPNVFKNKGYAEGWNAAIAIIESAPTLDIQQTVHASWCRITPSDNSRLCSACLFVQSKKKNAKQWPSECQKCGAKMDGGEELGQ